MGRRNLSTNRDQGRKIIVEIGGYITTLEYAPPYIRNARFSFDNRDRGSNKKVKVIANIPTIPINIKSFGLACFGGSET